MALNRTASQNTTAPLLTTEKPISSVIDEKQSDRGHLEDDTGRCVEQRGRDKESVDTIRNTLPESREMNSERLGPMPVEHGVQVAQRSACARLDASGRILGDEPTNETSGLTTYGVEHERTAEDPIASTHKEDPQSTSSPTHKSSQCAEGSATTSSNATTASTGDDFSQSSNREGEAITRMRALLLRCAPPEESEEVTVGGAVYWSDDDKDKCSVCERDQERLDADSETCPACVQEEKSNEAFTAATMTRMRGLLLRCAPPEDSEEVTVGGAVYWSDDDEDKCSVCDRDHERLSVDHETCSACVQEQRSDKGPAGNVQENLLAGKGERTEAATAVSHGKRREPLLSLAKVAENVTPFSSPSTNQDERTKSTTVPPLASPKAGTRAPEDVPSSPREGGTARVAPTHTRSKASHGAGDRAKEKASASSDRQQDVDSGASRSGGKDGQKKTVVVSPLAGSTAATITGASGKTTEEGSDAPVTHLKGTITSNSEDAASGNSESAGNGKRGDDTAPTTPRETPEPDAIALGSANKTHTGGRRWTTAANEKAALWGLPQRETSRENRGMKRTWAGDEDAGEEEEMPRAVRQKSD